MWLFTRYGFYSIVCARTSTGSLDPDTLQVRARAEDHLDRLHSRFPALADYGILQTPLSDYPWRMIVPKRVLAPIAAALILEIDWTIFRNEVISFQGEAGRHYLAAVHDVWDRMAHL